MARTRGFLRLWLLTLISYAAARLLVDLALRGAPDLRLVVAAEIAFVSLGQAVVYRLVTGGTSSADGPPLIDRDVAS